MPRSDEHVHELVDHLFRREFGRMVAALTRIFGLEHLDLAEDVVQDALMTALRLWPYRGIPSNPAAWLVQVARRRALDVLRRRGTLRRREDDLRRWAERAMSRSADAASESELDDELRMFFACCDERLGPEASTALTLRALCGFTSAEIGRALLCSEHAIAQRIVRAKRRIREEGITLELPDEQALPRRLDAVLEVLYLLFNEGYVAHRGDELIRADLLDEACRLVDMLARHPVTDRPRVHALAALMNLQRARSPARLGADHLLLTLAEQDRSRWDRDGIRRGLAHLQQAAAGESLSAYHLEAGIAAQHVIAPSFDETNWEEILSLYDMLMEVKPSPVVALNRAVAVSMARGPEAALALLDALHRSAALRDYYLLPATEGEVLMRAGRPADAAAHFHAALEHACTEPERDLLLRRLAACERAI